MCKKKVWVPKKVWVQKKEIILFRANIAPKKDKKVRAPKKVWVPEKRNLYFYRAQHCAKKSMGSKRKYEFKKKGTHTFSGQALCQNASMGSKKKYEFQNKGTHTFSGQTLCPKKEWPPPKKKTRQKELIPCRARHCAKKVWVPKDSSSSEKMNLSNFSGQTLSWPKYEPQKKDGFQEKELILLGAFFAGTCFFCLNLKSVQIKKCWKNGLIWQKSTQKYEFLFFEPVLFL